MHVFIKLPLWKHLSFQGTSQFYIPVFEGHIDADALQKWLNLLEGYFFFHNFSDRENITFALLKALPMSNIGGKLIGRKIPQRHPDGVLVPTTWCAEAERGGQWSTEPCARLVPTASITPEH